MTGKASTVWCWCGALTALCLSCAPPVRADPDVYDRAVRSTVFIIGVTPEGQRAAGSGALVDAEKRIVVTNYHVAAYMKANMKVVLAFFPEFQNGRLITDVGYYARNGKQLATSFEVVKADPKRDLAAIRLARVPSGARELKLALRSPKPGETLHSIGNSDALDGGILWRYSKGEVRQVYSTRFRAVMGSGNADSVLDVQSWVVESQVPSNPGDSGGPVLNSRGELVAVTESIDRKKVLITLGIDISEVRAFLRTAGVDQSAGKSRSASRGK
jgi:S1-C subfamily serine protease